MDKRKLIMMPIFLAAFLLNTGMTTAAKSNTGDLQAQSNKMQTGDDVNSKANAFNTSEYAKLFPENMIRGNPEYTRSLLMQISMATVNRTL